jgi:hypothetical protein
VLIFNKIFCEKNIGSKNKNKNPVAEIVEIENNVTSEGENISLDAKDVT